MAVAGSITATPIDLGGGYTKYSIVWTSDVAGAVTENPGAIKRGHIHQAKFIPNSGGTQPTDLYDMTLLDAISGGFDHLTGTGTNLSNANRNTVVPLIGDGTTKNQCVFHEGGNLYPTVANAGNAKGGVLELIVGP